MAELSLDRDNPYLGVYAVNVFVRDQDRSLRFYVDQLGFNLAFDVRLQSGQRWVGVAPPHGTAVLTPIAPEPDSDEYKLIGQPTPVAFVAEDVVAVATLELHGPRARHGYWTDGRCQRARIHSQRRVEDSNVSNLSPSPKKGTIYLELAATVAQKAGVDDQHRLHRSCDRPGRVRNRAEQMRASAQEGSKVGESRHHETTAGTV